MDCLPFINPTGVEYPSLVRLEGSALVVEFRKWSWRKMSKRLIEIRIPMQEVASIQHKKGILADHIDLQVRSMHVVGEIPCRKPGLIEMRFAKVHREAAHSLALRLRAAIAEQHAEQLGHELRRLQE